MIGLPLQNIVFPISDKHIPHRRLFYDGIGAYDVKNRAFEIPGQYTCNFTSYLNSFSIKKWKKYTAIEKTTLSLVIQGTFKIDLIGYHLEETSPVENILKTCSYSLNTPKELNIEYPYSDDTIIGFRITTFDKCFIWTGKFIGEFYSDNIRDVCLSLVTTTCKKEKFVTENLELLKQEILASDEDIKNNLYIHVIDNGKTLNKSELDSWHITVHPNSNTGGSGGFSKGMLESLIQPPKATHVLLMDDDVLILPESIKRTYALLKVLKPLYHNCFVSGAMLYYENMSTQHEDIGTVTTEGFFSPLKPPLLLNNIKNVILNEENWTNSTRQYAAWWYCCIPVNLIEENGFSMPFFIRGDDVEYSLRCKAEIITMNGICIWHMGFEDKFSNSLNRYQEVRNMLIIRDVIDCCNSIKYINTAKKLFRQEILCFNYNGAEMVLRAINHYLQGPLFLKKICNEDIFKENNSKNEKLIPLASIFPLDQSIDIKSLKQDLPRKKGESFIYKLTYNGHRFLPINWLKKKSGIIAWGAYYQPQRQSLHKKLLAINISSQTGIYRSLDKTKYKKLKKEFYKLLLLYYMKHRKIQKEYRLKQQILVSAEYWKNII